VWGPESDGRDAVAAARGVRLRGDRAEPGFASAGGRRPADLVGHPGRLRDPGRCRGSTGPAQAGLLGIGIVLGAVQVILHEIFTASAMPAAGTGMGNSMNAGSGVLDDAAAMHPGGDAWMLLAHAAAVPVTAGILNHGDTVIVLLLAWLRPVPAILAPPLPLPRPALSAVPAHPILACPLALRACASVVRRGPPVPAC
jgi:hypothetical protein